MKQEHPMTPGVLVPRVPGGAHPLYPKASVLIDADVSYSSDSAPLQQSTDAETIQRAADILGSQGMETWDQIAAELRTMLATAPQAEDPWTPSGVEYDRAIHHNPDAKAWADLFVQTFPGLSDKHDLMIGWFANAMMAMHDHLAKRESEQAERAVEPFMYGIADPDGKAHMDEFCVSREAHQLEADVEALNSESNVGDYRIIELYTASITHDVSGLVEALEDIAGKHHHSASAGGYFAKVARDALVAHKKEGKS